MIAVRGVRMKKRKRPVAHIRNGKEITPAVMLMFSRSLCLSSSSSPFSLLFHQHMIGQTLLADEEAFDDSRKVSVRGIGVNVES